MGVTNRSEPTPPALGSPPTPALPREGGGRHLPSPCDGGGLGWGRLVRVVLVRPTIAANLGATARVMANFGLSDLRLVAPEADPRSEEAQALDAWRTDPGSCPGFEKPGRSRR